MSFDKSITGVLYAVRQCLRQRLSAGLSTRQTESQGQFQSSYVLPAAPDNPAITLAEKVPAALAGFPLIAIAYEGVSWANEPTAGADAQGVLACKVKWWFTHTKNNSVNKLSHAQVAVCVQYDIHNAILRTLRNTTTGVAASYNAHVTNIIESGALLPPPRLASNSADIYRVIGELDLNIKYNAGVV